MIPTPWPRRVARATLVALTSVIALFLVGRGVVEIVGLDPAHPETYRDDWGGPHYLGVLLVHTGPGLLVLALAARLVMRRRHPRDKGTR